MVGVGTVLADDPILTVRLPGLEHRSPVRVVLDTSLRTPPESRLVATVAEAPTWIIAGEGAPVEAERRLVGAGVQVMRVDAPAGHVHIPDALALLATRGITRVFSEGGPSLGDALAEADVVDTFALARNCGALADEGIPALGPTLCAALSERFALASTEELGGDRLEIFERTR
jgi:diaminohydroxyphosphoribosylaminopyrimidine deaminase / 5-amino-6-(5-phosphoribosylamino)uracil reductase